MLERCAAELDFVQAVIDLVSTNDSLNPSMNAVAEAFRRRLLSGRFSTADHSIKVDALLFAGTKDVNDSDCQTSEVKDRQAKGLRGGNQSTNRLVCFDFQRGACR